MAILDKILLYLYYNLFILPPLVMTSITSELFEFNKMIIIYLLTVLILCLWLLKMILIKRVILKKTPFDLVILLFFLSQLFSTFFSIDRHTSIFGYYSRFNGGLLSIISYLILYYGFISNFKNNRRLVFNLIKVSLVTSLIVILWGLPGKLGYDLSCFVFTGKLNNYCWAVQFRPAERMFSTLGQPNWLGAYLAINFFISLYFIFKDFQTQSLFSQLLNLSISFLIFSSILFTRSRSALISVLIGLILFIFFQMIFYLKYDRIQHGIKKILVLFFVLLIPIILFKTGIEKIDRLLHYRTFTNPSQTHKVSVQHLSSVTESFDIRKIVWKGAIDLGLKYPFFGTGVETFAYSYYFVRPKEHNLTSEWDYLYNKAHNEYLNYLATTGFFGLGSYLILIGAVCFYGLNKLKIKNEKLKITIKNLKLKNNEAIEQLNELILIICFLLAYISILITNFFGFSTTTINLFFYLIPAFLLIENDKLANKNELVKVNGFKLSLFQNFNIFILLFAISYLLFAIFRYWVADINYAAAENYAKIGSYQVAANFLDRALKLKYEHIYEDKLSSVLANLALSSYSENAKDLGKNLMILSDSYNKKSIKASPKNVLYWKTRAKNYYLFYQITLNSKAVKEGIFALEEAKKLSPTDPKISYSLAIFYSLLADESKDREEKQNWERKSLEEINQSIFLKSNYRDGYFLKGQLLKKYGKRKEAKEVLKYILEKINPGDKEVEKEISNL